MILRYNNPLLVHINKLKGLSIFEWLDQDWNKIYEYLENYLNLFKIVENTEVDMQVNLHQPMKNSKYKINYTVYDKDINIQIKNNEYTYKLNIFVPKLINGYFWINKNEKFPIVQVVDLPLINRNVIKNKQQIIECRLINNFGIFKLKFDSKKEIFMFQSILGSNNNIVIPFVIFFLVFCIKMGYTQFYEIKDDEGKLRIKFKDKYEIFNELYKQDIININEHLFLDRNNLEIDNEDYWDYVIGRYVLKNYNQKKNKISYIKYGNSFIKRFITSIKMDWFTSRFYNIDELFLNITDKYNSTNDEVNNLKNKRIRTTEYLIFKIINELYNQFLSIPFMKSVEKNIDLVNVWNSDLVKSNIQLSNNFNPIACISEMDRLSYLGLGGFDSKHNLIELRDIHPSYYKNIDPIMTPDREKSGVVMNTCLLAKFDEYGRFLHVRGND